ncbi:MAG TPA: AAA family ATPase [Ornithinibacter sp.]|nr:AAA family ATPase [Ornithinibacter sp.]
MRGGAPLLGRDAEQRQVGTLLTAARNGRGGALLLLGEPGIGTSTLLASAAGARGMNQLRVTGYEAESTIPFAALYRLMLPLRPPWSARSTTSTTSTTLLRTALPEPIDPAAAAQIATATGGNPLALLDLASQLDSRRLTESSLADEPIPLGHSLEAFCLRRVRHLTPDLEEWLLRTPGSTTTQTGLRCCSSAGRRTTSCRRR